MSAVNQLVAPYAVIVQRITRDMAEGKLLAGLSWTSGNPVVPKVVGMGEQDLPCITLADKTSKEEKFSGAKPGPNNPGGTQAKDTNSSNLQLVEVVNLLLYVSRVNAGMFDPTGTGEPGLWDWENRLRQCINTADDGETDGCLNATCYQPIFFDVKEELPADLSLMSRIEITVRPKPHVRGTNMDLMDTTTGQSV